jgi:hypothetical protein
MVNGKSHIQKATDMRKALTTILKRSDNSYDMSDCQKKELHGLANPYIDKINTALATPKPIGATW